MKFSLECSKEPEFTDYNVDPSTVEWKVSSDLFFVVWKRNNYNNDPVTGATWFLQRTENKVFLILEESRGKTSPDWNHNLDYYPKMVDAFGVKVHEGLLSQYVVFRDDFINLCKEDGVTEVYIAGYSLGGGLAQIAYLDAVLSFGKARKVKGINFEGPRVFSISNKLGPYFKDFVNVRSHMDIVIHMPLVFMFSFLFRPYVRVYPNVSLLLVWTGKLEFSTWKYYGKQVWIGRWLKFIPYPHIPYEILKNLDKKYGTHCSFLKD